MSARKPADTGAFSRADAATQPQRKMSEGGRRMP
jgi:hypothetical protein